MVKNYKDRKTYYGTVEKISKKTFIYILTSSINPEDIKKVDEYDKKHPFSIKHLIKPVTKEKLNELAISICN